MSLSETRCYHIVLYVAKIPDSCSGSANNSTTHSLVTNSESPFPKQASECFL